MGMGMGMESRASRNRGNSTSGGGCGKMDGLAMWFINGIASAFFASLEHCSCIHIATVDESDDANELPLICNDGNFQGSAATPTRITTTAKGKGTKGKGTKGKNRGGFAQDFMDDHD